MFELLGSLLLLIVLEIVLGIDNLVFITILADRLPAPERTRARQTGLALALLGRIGLLLTIDWMMELTRPLFSVMNHGVSGRDLILGIGGLFLLYKASHGIYEEVEGGHQVRVDGASAPAKSWQVILQIILLDVVFSIDSVITAVGTVDEIWVMVTAVMVAIAIMLVASNGVAGFVNRHPSVKMLALGFLIMIGMSLMAEGAGYHVPKGYIYTAMTFAVFIQAMDMVAARRRRASAEHPAGKPSSVRGVQ
jgi:predicted tellurium resistance membrane protein TerC